MANSNKNMTTQPTFNLSEKIIQGRSVYSSEKGVIFSSDVKEFIRVLKKTLDEEIVVYPKQHTEEIIDALAGDKIK
jgi:hypothetical protein